MKRIAATDLLRNIGTFLRHAAEGPVTVTAHGRENAVLLSAAAYRELVANQAPARPKPSGDNPADAKGDRDRADRF